MTAHLWPHIVSDFIFWGSKISADGDCSHEVKRCLLLGRNVMTNLDSMLKSRDITLPTKIRPVKTMFFPVVMYGCERWTIKKAEHRSIDAFELWCWNKLLRVPRSARRSSQSILVYWFLKCWRSLLPPQLKSINSSVLSFLYSPTLTWIHDHWKNHSLD